MASDCKCPMFVVFWAMATQAVTSPFRIGIAAVTGALFRENERGASALIGSPIFCAVHLDDERRFHHLWKVPEDRAKLKELQQALSLEASATALNSCFAGSRSAAPGVFVHTPRGFCCATLNVCRVRSFLQNATYHRFVTIGRFFKITLFGTIKRPGRTSVPEVRPGLKGLGTFY